MGLAPYQGGMKTLLSSLFVVLMANALSGEVQAQARKRIDLDDTRIRGDLQNDDRLLILARQRNELKNYVKFRTHFRDEILQEMPQKTPNKLF